MDYNNKIVLHAKKRTVTNSIAPVTEFLTLAIVDAASLSAEQFRRHRLNFKHKVDGLDGLDQH